MGDGGPTKDEVTKDEMAVSTSASTSTPTPTLLPEGVPPLRVHQPRSKVHAVTGSRSCGVCVLVLIDPENTYE